MQNIGKGIQTNNYQSNQITGREQEEKTEAEAYTMRNRVLKWQ